ncbi:uncharacterized protein TrAtP1_003747 [Trichoderma atroviride]|uniref:uncharacterized protein n=1 Tax=Hypocrea atroviridis TaxID=63577 RepID=UPI0033191BFD|nr:hypothetical protein TrAtP1_003747 [Trichoderma atroviride]
MLLDRRQGAPDSTTVADGQGSVNATDAPRTEARPRVGSYTCRAPTTLGHTGFWVFLERAYSDLTRGAETNELPHHAATDKLDWVAC